MPDNQDTEEQKGLSWGVRRRLDFIDFRLLWDARINRRDLIERFGISPPLATADLERYAIMSPNSLRYDANLKTFVREPGFRPTLIDGQADRHLLQLQALRLGWLEREQTWFDNPPPTEVATLKRRPLSDDVMMPMIDGIREGRRVAITYWTMSGRPASRRVIAPHSLAFGAGRWHVRAWNADHNDFRDFNLGRIEAAELLPEPGIDKTLDYEWSTIGKLRLRPNSLLSAEEQAAVRREFEFDTDELIIPSRLALLIYLRSEFGLDDCNLDPQKRHLVLENAKELEALRQSARTMASVTLEARLEAGD